MRKRHIPTFFSEEQHVALGIKELHIKRQFANLCMTISSMLFKCSLDCSLELKRAIFTATCETNRKGSPFSLRYQSPTISGRSHKNLQSSFEFLAINGMIKSYPFLTGCCAIRASIKDTARIISISLL